jgi:hypothetical protein
MIDSTTRVLELGDLRRKVWTETLKAMSRQLDDPPQAPLVRTTDEFDAAVLALADKLREPERCFSCGQEIGNGKAP